MRKNLQKLTGLALAIMFAAPMFGAASAHAVIVSAMPTADQHVPSGKLAIRIEFNSRIDKVRSRLRVTASSGLKADVLTISRVIPMS
jgi:methionine-rich copper-binding protein CopC